MAFIQTAAIGYAKVALGFFNDEWQHLKGLLAAALKSPKLRTFGEKLELVYGEL